MGPLAWERLISERDPYYEGLLRTTFRSRETVICVIQLRVPAIRLAKEKPAEKARIRGKDVDEWRNDCMEAMRDWMERSREAVKCGKCDVPPMPSLPPMPHLRHGPPGFGPHSEHFPPFFGPPRSNVVASRIHDEGLRVVDMLVEAGLFSTRSEAVAYLVTEGIKARKDVVDQVSGALGEIREIAKQKEQHIARLRKQIGIAGPESSVEPSGSGDESP